MTDALRESYDEKPYPGHAYEPTHPDRLATIAILHGLTPPPVETARVLDLGCSDGGNLLPMAVSLPRAQLVGVDLSPRQIALGREVLAETGVTNVDLRAMSLSDIDASFGTFDYIVCHGVYSWVPAPVQADILRILRENLSPEGVAFLSYNTYPGWHFRDLVRRMMLFHTRGQGREERPGSARELLDMLLSVVKDSTPYGLVLREEEMNLRDQPDSYLLHEHLEEENHPLYFHELVSRLEEAGLAHVSDAHPSATADRLRREQGPRIASFARDPLEVEQYLDFFQNQCFRRSVVTRKERAPLAEPSADGLRRLRVEARLRRPPDRSRLDDDSAVTFQGVGPLSLTTNEPTLKTALDLAASAAPEPVPFTQILDETAARLGRGVDAPALAAGLLAAFRAEMVVLHAFRPPFVTAAGERPVVSPAARHAALHSARLPSLFHRVVEVDALGMALVRHLDGTHAVPDLVDALCEDVTAGRLEVTHEGEPVKDGRALAGTFVAGLPVALLRLAASALLVG